MDIKYEIPDRCTRCGKLFDEVIMPNGKTSAAFPWPPKEYLCFECLIPIAERGLGRLNKVLAGEKITKEDYDT